MKRIEPILTVGAALDSPNDLIPPYGQIKDLQDKINEVIDYLNNQPTKPVERVE